MKNNIYYMGLVAGIGIGMLIASIIINLGRYFLGG
jgi:hypothetical protein